MGITEDTLDTLAPSTQEVNTSSAGSDKTTGYAWAIFYVIIIALIIFFIMIALMPSFAGKNGETHNHGLKKRGKIDETSYGWYLLFSIILAAIIVACVAYFRKGKKKTE